MYKVIITTVLDPNIKSKLTEYSKKTYIPYSKLIEYAVKEFKNNIGRSSNYLLKYADFDRIKTQSFTCSVPSNLNEILLKLSQKLGISKRLLVREIITGYVLNID
jgi:hypothetical protein